MYQKKKMTLEDVLNLIDYDPSSTSLSVYFYMGSQIGTIYDKCYFCETSDENLKFLEDKQNLNRYMKCKVYSVYVAQGCISICLTYDTCSNIDGKVWFLR